jgi:hypothetical protein
VSTKQAFAEYPLRHSMDLVELGARSMDLVDLEFLELGCLAGKKWSGAVFVDLELCGALPNTPLFLKYFLLRISCHIPSSFANLNNHLLNRHFF